MSAAHWGPDADRQVDGRSNAEYLTWVTETIADRKLQLIAALELQPGQTALDAMRTAGNLTYQSPSGD